MSRLPFSLRTTAVLLLGLWAVAPAAAQSFTWNDPTTGNWSVGTNWSGGAAPPSGSTTQLIFNGTGTDNYTATNNIANPFVLNSLTFNNTGSGAITINSSGTGGGITFAGTSAQLVYNGSGAVNLSVPVNLTANTLITGTGNGFLTFGGPINDGGSGFGLTSASPATLLFTSAQASSFNHLRLASGSTQISSGSWMLTSTGDLHTNAALSVGTTAGQTASFTLSGGANLTIPNGYVFFGGDFDSGATVVITGAGTTLNAGTIVVGQRGTVSTTIAGGAIVNSGGGFVADVQGSIGTVIVDGAGSQWVNTNSLRVGFLGAGSLTVQNGGHVNGGILVDVGFFAGSSSLSILSGGTFTAVGSMHLGVFSDGTGTVTVSGSGSALTFTETQFNNLRVGGTSGGTGHLTVSAGGSVVAPNVVISAASNSVGNLLIDAGTLSANNLVVARAGSGSMTVQNGGIVTAGGNIVFGELAGSTGTATIAGAGTTITATSTATNTGLFVVGENGTGSVTISGGAVVNSRLGTLGRQAGSSGTAVVEGAGSRWAVTETLLVGPLGTGSLTVQTGGQVSAGTLSIGQASNSSMLVLDGGSVSAGNVSVGGGNSSFHPSLTVGGAGAQVIASGQLGVIGGGQLFVNAGGQVQVGTNLFIDLTSSGGNALVSGGTLTVQGGLFMAQQATAVLTIDNGGQVTVSGNAFLATASGTGGRIDVLQNSRLTLPGPGTFLVIGGGSGAGQGDLFVSAGGAVNHTGPQITLGQDASSIGRAFVFNGASITTSGNLVVGQAGTGRLDMQNGGTVNAGGVIVASLANSSGSVTVNGAGTTLLSNGALRLAGSSGGAPGGTATFTVESGASAAAVGLATLFGGATVNVNAASLTVGGLNNGTAASFGNVNLSNNGALTIVSPTGAAPSFAGVIGGAGSLTKAGPGPQTLTGVNTYTGPTNINAGTLILSGTGSIADSPVVTIAPGAVLDVTGVIGTTGGFLRTAGQSLRGHGTVTGGVRAAAGSTVAPGTPAGSGQLTSNGNLTLEAGSTFATRISIGVAGFDHDQVVVPSGVVNVTGSTLTLSGTVPVTPDYVMTALRNTANNPVVGTFANPAVPGDPLGRLDFGQYAANISYFGSNGMISGGNDIVLYNIVPVPEPAAVLGAAALVGLAVSGWRRRPGRRVFMPD